MYNELRSPAAVDPIQWGLHLAHALMVRALNSYELLARSAVANPPGDDGDQGEPDGAPDVDDQSGGLDKEDPRLLDEWFDQEFGSS